MSADNMVTIPVVEEDLISSIMDSILNNEMKAAYDSYLKIIKQYRHDDWFQLENEFLSGLRSAIAFAIPSPKNKRYRVYKLCRKNPEHTTSGPN